MSIKLDEVKQGLNRGGFVRFEHNSCSAYLSGEGQHAFLDGRTYHGFLQTVAPNLTRMETGSIEKKNLVITWRIHMENMIDQSQLNDIIKSMQKAIDNPIISWETGQVVAVDKVEYWIERLAELKEQG